MIKLHGWQPHDAVDIQVWETVTRCIDLPNNTNKYRRFLTVWSPGETPITFTQTGRWTTPCNHNQWLHVGAFREFKVASHASWVRAGRDPERWHDTMVAAKRGNYTQGNAQSTRHVLLGPALGWLRKVTKPVPLVESENAGTAQPTQPVQPVQAQPVQVSGDALVDNITKVLAQVDTGDPFDLIAEVSVLRKRLEARKTQLLALESDLEAANATLLGRF